MKQKKKKGIKVRRLWKIKPATKVKESAKRYDRRQTKRELQKQWSQEL